MKSFILTTFKLIIATGLIFYLVHQGDLDFKQLSLFVTDPTVAFAAVSYWLIAPTIIGATRWKLLLKAQGINISLQKTISLQMTGFFFNTAMPGAVGGDLIKAMYVIRINGGNDKAKIMLSTLTDRILGMVGIFSIGLIALLINTDLKLENNAAYSTFLITSISVCVGAFLFFAAALKNHKSGDPIKHLLSKNIIGFTALLKIYEAIRVFKENKRTLIGCYVLSIILQLMSVGYFYTITTKITQDSSVNFWSIASVFPIGILTISLPISPGGLGVGHVAFDRLFQSVGLAQGAGVFNIFLLSQIALNMTGCIPYLRTKAITNEIKEVNTAITSL